MCSSATSRKCAPAFALVCVRSSRAGSQDRGPLAALSAVLAFRLHRGWSSWWWSWRCSGSATHRLFRLGGCNAAYVIGENRGDGSCDLRGLPQAGAGHHPEHGASPRARGKVERWRAAGAQRLVFARVPTMSRRSSGTVPRTTRRSSKCGRSLSRQAGGGRRRLKNVIRVRPLPFCDRGLTPIPKLTPIPI